MQVETWGSVGAAMAAISAAVVSPFLVNLKSRREMVFQRKRLEDEFASKQTNATWEQAEWLVSQLRVDADSLRKRVEKSEEDATNAQRRAETCERQSFQAQSMILELQGQVKSLQEQISVGP